MEGEQVVEKILSDARAEAARIKAEADEKQASEQAKVDEQLSRYRRQSDELARKAAEDRKNRILAAARMKIARDYLAEKTKILDEVFAAAQQQITTMPEAEYRDWIIKMMSAAAVTGDEEVVIDANERRIDQALIDRVNSRLAQKGRLKLSNQKQNLDCGFILQRGRTKNNASLKVLLSQARKSLEIELAKTLFAG